jgi:hypothetical protein
MVLFYYFIYIKIIFLNNFIFKIIRVIKALLGFNFYHALKSCLDKYAFDIYNILDHKVHLSCNLIKCVL